VGPAVGVSAATEVAIPFVAWVVIFSVFSGWPTLSPLFASSVETTIAVVSATGSVYVGFMPLIAVVEPVANTAVRVAVVSVPVVEISVVVTVVSIPAVQDPIAVGIGASRVGLRVDLVTVF
jgi:hypothetical protein